jgi:hypothetical protein
VSELMDVLSTGKVILCLSLWMYCRLARTSHRPISQTAWLNVRPCKPKSKSFQDVIAKWLLFCSYCRECLPSGDL